MINNNHQEFASPEIEINKGSNIILLNEMTGDQTEQLKEKITKGRGLLRIFVHPYYEEHTTHHLFPGRSVKPEAEKVSEKITQLLCYKSDNKPPIIILEDEFYLEDTFTRILPQLIESGETVYVMPTYRNWGIPKYHDSLMNEGENDWTQFIDKLSQLGVKKVLIGGMNLRIDKEQRANQHYPYTDQVTLKGGRNADWVARECVGKVLNNLAPKFNIEVSHLSYPHNRTTINRISF